jgi:leucyl aminopeptidase (aminopeptidase T)
MYGLVLAVLLGCGPAQAPPAEPVVGPPAPRDGFLGDEALAARERARTDARAKVEAQRAGAEQLKLRQQRPDNLALAERLGECAAVAAGDLVLVRGGAREAALLEAVAAEVRRRGGSPLVVLAGDRLDRALLDRSGPELDARPNELELKLATIVTAVMEIEPEEAPGEFAPIPGARLAGAARARALADEVMRRRGVRRVELGNGLYPTPHRAGDYAMSEEELSRVFWLAATVDAALMRENGLMLAGSLTPGARGAITNPNGTDLKFRLAPAPRAAGAGMDMMMAGADGAPGAGARASLSDGAAPPGPGLPVRLPAGELSALVAPGAAEGRLVADRLLYGGREITGLTVTFRAGRVTGLSARSGIEHLRGIYDASGPGRDQLSAVVIGLNPDLRAPSGVKLSSALPEGMVSVVIGGNAALGGDSTEAFSLTIPLPGSTLRVEGRPVVIDGALAPTSPLPPEDDGTGAPGAPAALSP